VTTENTRLRAVVDRDGAAILDIERGLVSTLNRAGAYVWQRLHAGTAVETIIEELAHETGEEIHLIEHDVREFVEVLKEKQLLRN
jgi:hydrogenase maturation factor